MLARMGEHAVLEIGTITLDWSDWMPWLDLLIDRRSGGGVLVPKTPGVYEVKYTDHDGGEQLAVGRAADLNDRVGLLVRGNQGHSTGRRIRERGEDLSRLVVRWAGTARPGAAEEELHQAYRSKFGTLPTYTRNS